MDIQCTHCFVTMLIIFILMNNMFSQVILGLQESLVSMVGLGLQQAL